MWLIVPVSALPAGDDGYLGRAGVRSNQGKVKWWTGASTVCIEGSQVIMICVLTASVKYLYEGSTGIGCLMLIMKPMAIELVL